MLPPGQIDTFVRQRLSVGNKLGITKQSFFYKTKQVTNSFTCNCNWRRFVQGSAKEWSLGCVKHVSFARGGQDLGFKKPRDHSLADPCTKITYRI